MKGDFSKKTFDARKHYKDVNMQQGRVLLDTDWNEQNDITGHRIETETIDTVGIAGAPMHAAGFEIIPVDNAANPVASNGVDLKISEGRFYVDGILCENESGKLFADQPDFDKTALPNAAGRYIFYLDVWQRHITALEDTEIREVALGGPDTTTRSKTVWQVKFLKGQNNNTCVDLLPTAITAAPSGKLMARAELPAGTDNPCGLETSGGYRRLENQLYRVEIHKGSANRANATFKWSRDNGSIVVKWESIDASNPDNLIVSSAGRDELLGFKSGDWVELIDDQTDLLGLPGLLVQLSKVDGNVLTINPATIIPAGSPVTLSAKNPRIRRWDSAGELKPNTNNTDWVELEDGIQVQFKEGSFRSGDYWLIPARTSTANIEWPFTEHQSPQGIQHHFAKLAICTLSFSGNTPQWTRIGDCRPIFPPLTELTSLYYVGGDGQETMPNKPLPTSLKVGVSNGQWAVPGARVKFVINAPGVGTLNLAGGIATTNAEGIAECQLTLGPFPTDGNFSIQVNASLLDSADNIATGHLPVIFNASYSVADEVYYNSGCTNWSGAKPDTVAKALDELCERKADSKSCSFTIGPKGDFKTLQEAIEKLFEKQQTDISLCFMPGEHGIDKEILMLRKEMSFTTLKITGYAARITMKAKRMELVADKIILQGFSLMANPENSDINDTQILLSAGEINMDYCYWNKVGKSDLPFITIHKEGLVYLKNNKILGWFSLVLANGVQGIIESNLISYLLLQNVGSDPFAPSPLLWTNENEKKLTRARLQDNLKMTDWSLTIRGNRIGAIVTNVNKEKPFDLYQNMIISENIFQFPINSFLAKFLQLVNNQFLYEDPNNNPSVVSYILGINIIVMGNSGFIAESHGFPSILASSIDAIVLGMIVGKGVGENQILNLVKVIA